MFITYRRKLIFTIADVYFAGNENVFFERKPDIAFYLQKSEKVKNSIDFYTLHIDLLKDEKSLLSGLDKNTRWQINKATRQGIIKCELYRPTDEEVLDFVDYYNHFAQNKKIPKCSQARLIALHDADTLFLSKASDGEDKVLCYHAYIIDEKRARCLYSASHFRESSDTKYRVLVGMANRYLHWNDMIAFKNQGLSVYDFGGVVPQNDKNQERQNITKFKAEFGGKMVEEYNLIEGQTFIGKILVFVYNVYRRLRE